MVAAVAARRAAAPAEFEALATRARAVVARAERALAAGEARELGAAFAEGHELLRRIGVVTGGVERLVRAARDAGAAGAKVTGAGGGGIVIAVQAEAETAAVAERLRAAGVRVVSAGPLGAGLTSRAASPRSRRSRPRPRRRA
jgi:mevalonate kinase